MEGWYNERLLWNTSSSRAVIRGDHSMGFGAGKPSLQPGRPHVEGLWEAAGPSWGGYEYPEREASAWTEG